METSLSYHFINFKKWEVNEKRMLLLEKDLKIKKVILSGKTCVSNDGEKNKSIFEKNITQLKVVADTTSVIFKKYK